MSYRYTFNGDHNYLIHFNKNHSKANGQFISGDGDDDGIIDDHHNYSRNKKGDTSGSNIENSEKKSGIFSPRRKMSKTERNIGIAVALSAAAIGAAGAFITIKKKSNLSSGNFGSGKDFVRAQSAKVIGGDW